MNIITKIYNYFFGDIEKYICYKFFYKEEPKQLETKLDANDKLYKKLYEMDHPYRFSTDEAYLTLLKRYDFNFIMRAIDSYEREVNNNPFVNKIEEIDEKKDRPKIKYSSKGYPVGLTGPTGVTGAIGVQGVTGYIDSEEDK